MAWSQSHHMPWASDQRRKMLARIASIALYLLLIPTLVFDSAQSVYAQAECQLEAGADTCSGHQTDPGTTQSSKMHKRHVGNPIDVISGNKYQRGDDYIAFASPLVFFRHYNTADAHANQGMGQGWRHTYSLRLYQQAGEFHLIQSDGRKIVFNRLSEDGSSLTTGDDADGKLLQTTPMTWQQPNGQNWEFSGSYPIRLITADGMSLSLTYRNKRLHTVTDDTGASLSFVYTEGENGLVRYSKDHNGEQPGHLSCLQLPDGSGVKYQYDTNKNLIGALHHSGNDWTYRYSDKRHVSHITEASYFPLRISEPNRCNDHVPLAASSETYKDALNVSQWTYDDDGRAISWIGNNPKQRIDVGYDVKYTDANAAEGFVFGSEVSHSIRERVYRYVPVVDDVTGDVGGIDIKAKECDGCGWEKLIDFAQNVSHDVGKGEKTDSHTQFLSNRAGIKTKNNVLDSELILGRLRGSKNLSWSSENEPGTELSMRSNQIDFKSISDPTNRFCPLSGGLTCSQIDEALVYAELSDCAYVSVTCPSDWGIIDPRMFGLPDKDMRHMGLRVLLLHNRERDEFVLTFEGTNISSFLDLATNFANLYKNSEQYTYASQISTYLSTRIASQYPSSKLTFTGHSLGGGLATIAALSSNNNAIVFNPASVSDKALTENSVSSKNHQKLIDAIIHNGDFAQQLQTNLAQNTLGTHFKIGDPKANKNVKNHKLKTSIAELQKMYNDYCIGNP